MNTRRQLHMCIHDYVHYTKLALNMTLIDAWHDFDSSKFPGM